MTMSVVPGFIHRPGRHCGSTSLQNLVNWGGWPLSEAACFGMGSGLDSIFLAGFPGFPLGSFLGRGGDLEDFFFNNLGLGSPRTQAADFAEMTNHISAKLSAEPVMVQGDVAGLDYYNSPEHFAGHKFLLVGRADDGRFLSADTAFPELIPVTPVSLEKSVSYESELFPGRFQYFDLKFPLPPLRAETIVPAVHRALVRTADHLENPRDLGAHMASSAAGFSLWKKHCDFKSMAGSEGFALSARFAYQVIEKRGTGRAAFRYLFRDFLQEILDETLLPYAGPVRCFDAPDARNTIRELIKLTDETADRYRRAASVYKMISIGRKDLNAAGSEMNQHIDFIQTHEKEMALVLKSLVRSV